MYIKFQLTELTMRIPQCWEGVLVIPKYNPEWTEFFLPEIVTTLPEGVEKNKRIIVVQDASKKEKVKAKDEVQEKEANGVEIKADSQDEDEDEDDNNNEASNDLIDFIYYLDCGNASLPNIQAAIDAAVKKLNSEECKEDGDGIVVCDHYFSRPSNPFFIPIVCEAVKQLNASTFSRFFRKHSPVNTSDSGSDSEYKAGMKHPRQNVGM